MEYRRRWRPHALGLILMLAALLATPTCGGETEAGTLSGAGMAEANRLYDAGQFDEALARYEVLVGSGVQDGSLYYNLANAHFKAGNLGHAVLNYRRAQRLLPRDGDVVANLKLARAQAVDRLDPAGEGVVISSLRRLVGWTTLDETAILALALWIVLGALIVGAILWTRGRRVLLAGAVIAAVLMVLILFTLGIRVWDERDRPEAVVVADEVSVNSGPGTDYLTEFVLHSGAEVRLVEERADWTRIALPGDLQGWLPNESVIAVVPR
jgi:tetratricopeptide (TPR) repeat protein